MTLFADSQGAQVLLHFANLHKCLRCRHKFTDPWLVPTGKPFPDNVMINAEVVFHWQDSHGFPAEDLIRIVSDSIYRNEDEQSYA